MRKPRPQVKELQEEQAEKLATAKSGGSYAHVLREQQRKKLVLARVGNKRKAVRLLQDMQRSLVEPARGGRGRSIRNLKRKSIKNRRKEWEKKYGKRKKYKRYVRRF